LPLGEHADPHLGWSFGWPPVGGPVHLPWLGRLQTRDEEKASPILPLLDAIAKTSFRWAFVLDAVPFILQGHFGVRLRGWTSTTSIGGLARIYVRYTAIVVGMLTLLLSVRATMEGSVCPRISVQDSVFEHVEEKYSQIANALKLLLVNKACFQKVDHPQYSLSYSKEVGLVNFLAFATGITDPCEIELKSLRAIANAFLLRKNTFAEGRIENFMETTPGSKVVFRAFSSRIVNSKQPPKKLLITHNSSDLR